VVELRPLQQFGVNFEDGTNHLAGILVKPVTSGSCPAIILVHGSKPVDRDSNGAFVALREHLAAQGYAVLSYDKPGVGESTGDWTRQSFYDRAHEVASALRFLRTRSEVDSGYVSLCGGSQAGWVMPIVPKFVNKVAFIVSISGAAVPVFEQERYRIEHQLRADKFADRQIEQALMIYDRRLEMIRQGASIEQVSHMQNEAEHEPWFCYLGDISPEDLGFFAKNYDFDPVPFLRQVRCPFLGIWGELDTYVPVERSMIITRDALAAASNVRFELKLLPKTNHGMRVAETGSPSEHSSEFAPAFWNTLTAWLRPAQQNATR
jgi:pimeloyl-ACP methyl ester carboxylesterase